MSRISIEVTPEQHQRLKACAALAGTSIKEYVLERVLALLPETGTLSEEKALEKLENFLGTRFESVKREQYVNKSMSSIFEEVQNEG